MLKKFWMGIVTILCAIAITITINYAWYINTYDVDPLAKGSSAEAYYHSGDGTSEHPYIITTQRHLYNLAWLQYLGTYNKPTTNGGTTYESTYFKLGLSANGTLDMTGWPLPPIGTAKYPFIGNFDGNGWTISNLTTTNNFTEFGDKHPSGITANGANGTSAFEQANCGTIGFFGAIGAYNNSVISDAVTTSTEGVSYPTTTNTATNFYLNNTSVHTSISSTILGAVAGYVNATISDIGVIQPHLNIQTSASAKLGTNLSDFAVVGYAESQYTTQKTKSSTIIYNPTYDYSHFNFKGMGSQADWGGSMNFADVYDRYRLNNSPKSNGTNFEYTYREIVKVDGTKISDTQNSSVFDSSYSNRKASKYYDSDHPENGEYLSWYRWDYDGEVEDFNYAISLSKEVYTITINGTVKTGYKIHDDDGNYLTINASSQVTNTTDVDDAVIWLCEGNKLYTFNEKIFSTTIKYYLSGTTSLNNALTTSSPSTNWYWDSDKKTFYYDYNSTRYYLKYYNSNWCVTPLYKISDGNGNYLKMGNTTNNTKVVNTRNADEATIWTCTTNGTNPSGTISAISGGTTRNLYINNGNLVTSSNATTWSNSGSGLYNGSNYIHYINGYWVASTNPSYKIGYGTHYLSTTGTDTTSDNAALWTFNNTLATNGGNGTISMVLNGTTNYLRNNDGTLEVSTTATTWYNDGGNKLYSIIGNQTYYLEYDSAWKLNVAEYYIKDQNSNYLTYASPTSITNATTATTLWHFSNANATYPNGTISCTQGGNTYYLNVSGTSLALSTASNTAWSNDGDGLYCTINSVRYYLVYDSEWKLVTDTYKIHSGTNYLSLDNNNNIVYTNEANATEWTFSNSGTNPSGTISSNGYYLYLNNGILATTATVDSALSFNNAGSGLYDNANNYIQFYNNKWVCGKAFNIKYGSTYMGFNGTNINTSTGVWFYYDNATDPQGIIYTVYGGIIYYLYSNGTSLTCNQNQNIAWQNSTGLYIESSGRKFITYYSSNWTIRTATITGYKISDGDGHYLVSTGNTDVSVGTFETASTWIVDSSNHIYTVINNKNYYLYPNTSTWAICTTNNPSNKQKKYQYSKDGRKILYDNGGSSNNLWHINYSNGWIESNNPFELTWTEVYDGNVATTTNVTTYQNSSVNQVGSTNRTTYVKETLKTLSITGFDKVSSVSAYAKLNTSTCDGYNLISNKSEKVSEFGYIPLNCKYDENDNITQTVDNSNTGYIVGGYYYSDPSNSSTFRGDYRVSKYALSNISDSYNYNTTPTAWKKILTVGANGYSADKYIGSETYPSSSFSKYTSSKDQLLDTLRDDTSNVYGLHFMSAAININHLVVAPKVLINGETYTNYELPEDAIDFNLASRGYINFFAGTYFKNNDSFFSLHQIIRDNNRHITAIKHISKIYEPTENYGSGWQSADFIYQYTDGTWSGSDVSSNSSYSLAFDKTWIESPQSLGSNLYTNFPNYLWYFEIPVNKGEYALGSVDGGIGAYLIYLDIGANAAPVDRTIIAQQSETTTEDLVYVNGIQILASTAYDTTKANTAVAVISTSITGDVTASRSGDTITFSSTGTLTSTFKDEGITISGATWSPVDTDTTVSKVLRYVDYNRATDKLYYTTIYNDGTNNTGYDCYRVNTSTGAKIDLEQDEWGILSIVNGSGTPVAAYTSVTMPDTFGTTKILDYYSYIDTSDIASLTQTIDMSVVADSSVVPQADGTYVYEHSYHLSGDAIIMTPNGLIVYIGPDTKTNATISGPTSYVATVTNNVSGTTYTFTFNASAINSIEKTVTIYVAPAE